MSETGKGAAWTRRELIAGGSGLALAAAGAGYAEPGASAAGDAGVQAQSTAAWERFCDSLKPLARHVSGGPALEDPLLRTEGLRCLSRLVSLGLDRFLEHGDPRFPDF